VDIGNLGKVIKFETKDDAQLGVDFMTSHGFKRVCVMQSKYLPLSESFCVVVGQHPAFPEKVYAYAQICNAVITECAVEISADQFAWTIVADTLIPENEREPRGWW